MCGKKRDNPHEWRGCKCAHCEETRDEDHEWSGCNCTVCGETRDEDHDWSINCEECACCGKRRDRPHEWKGCKCTHCEETRNEGHEWDVFKCTCCGQLTKEGRIAEADRLESEAVATGELLPRFSGFSEVEVTENKIEGTFWAAGLRWQREPPNRVMGLEDAERYATKLTLGGMEWRLPTVQELKALYDAMQSSPDLTTNLGMDEGWYWSGSPYPDGNTFCVNFDNGSVAGNVHGKTIAVRCVSLGSHNAGGGESEITSKPPATFRAVGLIWQREPAGWHMNWKNAKSYANRLTLAGGDWRLPTVEEWEALHKEKLLSSAIAAYPGMDKGVYWSATHAEDLPKGSIWADYIWAIDFGPKESGTYGYYSGGGKVSGMHQNCDEAVRCVMDIDTDDLKELEPQTNDRNIQVRIESFGIISVKIKGKIASPDSATGYINIYEETTLVKQTDRIPLRKGLGFGISFSIISNLKEETVALRQIIRFPPPGITNPAKNQTLLFHEKLLEYKTGEIHGNTYCFEQDYEMIPGEWKYEYWYGDSKLAEKVFFVERYDPDVEPKETDTFLNRMNILKRLFGGNKPHAPASVKAVPCSPAKQDETFTLPGGVKLVMVSINPGTFMMGSPQSEQGRRADETQHKVTLTKSFQIGKFLITQEQWQAVTGDNPSAFARCTQCSTDCPVELVSWDDCQEFISALNSHFPSGGFRLPTEAEWEYSCRAGTTGARYGELDKIAWYNKNSEGTIHPVGLKQPNAWGLYDMIGNVWQWCQDLYGDDGSQGPPTIDYPSGSATDPKGRSSGSFRVRRGAGWEDNAFTCRAANRKYNSPNLKHDFLGLRIARTLP